MKTFYYFISFLLILLFSSCKAKEINLQGLDLPIANSEWEDKVPDDTFKTTSKIIFKENTCELIDSNIFNEQTNKYTFTQNGSNIFLTPDYVNPLIKGIKISMASEKMIYMIVVHLDGRHSEGFPYYRVKKDK